MDYSADFIEAFSCCMKFEVGPWYDPSDPDTICGSISTPLHKRKCGYINSDGDTGGATKFGIAQADHPNVDVPGMTLAGAQAIYFYEYWEAGCCDQITIPITIFQFDTCVNNGVSRANKILQAAVGVKVDGVMGPLTLAAINHRKDSITLLDSLSKARIRLYNTIVKNNPSQERFLSGWLRRTAEVYQTSLRYAGNAGTSSRSKNDT